MTSGEARAVRGGGSAGMYDIIGVGFGPANLALAVALEEESEPLFGHKLTSLFLERRERFSWHPGMLLEDARVQLSFLKDLVTLREPRSHFTFLNYLKSKGRLDRFVNLRNFFPTRMEFNDYYRWVAEQLDDHVRYASEVVAIEPCEPAAGRPVEFAEVVVRDLATDQQSRYLARNLVIATGGVPFVPGDIDIRASRRTFHSQDFLHRLRRDYSDREAPYRFLVVGSGQSAAEIFQFLLARYPNATVTAALRRFAFKPADDSHFVNEIFFPDKIDMVYNLPPDIREQVVAAHRDTNYSAVDLDLIQEIYQTLYEHEVAGETRAHIFPFLELRSLVDKESGTAVQFYDQLRREVRSLEADGVILATGYRRPKRHPLLAQLEPHFILDDAGALKVERNYRVLARPEFRCNVFLQGFSEDTHGLSDTLLSNLPSRSIEILEGCDRAGQQALGRSEKRFSS